MRRIASIVVMGFLFGSAAQAGPSTETLQASPKAFDLATGAGIAWPKPGNIGRDWLLRTILPGYVREQVIGYFGPGPGQTLPGGIVARFAVQPAGASASTKLGKGGSLVIELSGALPEVPVIAECLAVPGGPSAQWNWTANLFSGQTLVLSQAGKAQTVAGFATFHQVIKPLAQGVDKVRFTLLPDWIGSSGASGAGVQIPQCRLTRPLPPMTPPKSIRIGGR